MNFFNLREMDAVEFDLSLSLSLLHFVVSVSVYLRSISVDVTSFSEMLKISKVYDKMVNNWGQFTISRTIYTYVHYIWMRKSINKLLRYLIER